MLSMDPLQAIQPSAPPKGAFWADWLILYVRALAVISLAKGLFHWSKVCGFSEAASAAFEAAPTAWKAATIFFAVMDLVAAVGLWLAAAWGGVVWLTAAISMAAIEFLFPQVYGGRWVVVLAEFAAIAVYLALAVQASRERAD